jgi:hypothetical protein
MRTLAGHLRYQHRPPRQFRSAAGAARTWLPDWQPERAQWLVPPSPVAPVPLGSPGLEPKQGPLPLVLRVLQARLQVPQVQPDWQVWAFPATWLRVQARL